MAIQFKRGERSNEYLRIGLVAGTGGGKTYTGMELATGMSGGRPFAVIDTEVRRALHYASDYEFDHADFQPQFRPDSYRDAVLAAESAGYPVIMIDSMSHEWEGEGGVLDWHDEELDRMAGTDWQKRESCNMAAWIKPKVAHKKMVQRLLQVRAHLIFCLRAEEKVDMTRDDKGKMKIVPKKSLTGLDGWIPICEKRFPFELTASFLLTNDEPGFPKPIKLEAQHRAMFPMDKAITRESGRKLADWARNAPTGPAAEIVSAAVKEYAECATPKFAELEKQRGDWWTKLTGEQKTALKAASDAAKVRLEAK